MPIIQGLPVDYPLADGTTVDLRVVPDGPRDPHDPERGAKRAEWKAWSERIRRYRHQRYHLCDDNIEEQAVELAKCQRYGAAYFLTVWGWMFDPREAEGRPIGPTPFIPYPFQIEMFGWLDTLMVTTGPRGDGVVSKSRDMGATWCCCGWALHGWFFKDAFQARLISRKEELVDRRNDMDSMFAKIDFMLERLPAWFIPQGFNREAHRMQLRLKNPANSNAINGEATTAKTLRGGRATIAFYDEAAFIEHFMGVWTTGASATAHRVAISTESMEEGDDFYRLGEGSKQDPSVRPAFLPMNWWTHPEHDDTWYREMKQRMSDDPEGFAREVERNTHAGFGTYIYAMAQTLDVGHFPYIQGSHVYLGIDPGFDDECAIVVLNWDVVSGRYRVVEAFANRMQPPEYYASLITGRVINGIDGFDYRHFGYYDPMALADLMRTVPSFTLFGDPAGSNKITGLRDSWYDRMNDWAQRNHPHGHGLSVVYSWDMDKRNFTGRRAALQRLLARTDFNDTPGVRALLQSLREYRFERATRDRMAEQVKPLHNSASHPVASLEYVAVNIEMTDSVKEIASLGVYDAA